MDSLLEQPYLFVQWPLKLFPLPCLQGTTLMGGTTPPICPS